MKEKRYYPAQPEAKISKHFLPHHLWGAQQSLSSDSDFQQLAAKGGAGDHHSRASQAAGAKDREKLPPHLLCDSLPQGCSQGHSGRMSAGRNGPSGWLQTVLHEAMGRSQELVGSARPALGASTHIAVGMVSFFLNTPHPQMAG